MIITNFYKLRDDVKTPFKAHPEDACFDLFADLLGVPAKTSYTVTKVEQSPHTSSPLLIVKTEEVKADLPLVNDSIYLPAGSSTIIPTGIILGIPKGYRIDVKARSGRAAKYRQGLTNGIGTIDSGYDNQLFVILDNPSGESKVIKHGDKIAQFSLEKVLDVALNEVKDRNIVQIIDTGRGTGGLGSTGDS